MQALGARHSDGVAGRTTGDLHRSDNAGADGVDAAQDRCHGVFGRSRPLFEVCASDPQKIEVKTAVTAVA